MRWLGLLIVVYTMSVLFVALLLNVFGDSWWAATVLLYGPRWIWAAPLAVLVPAAALWRRRFLAPLAASALVVLGPVMGLRVSLGAVASSVGDDAPPAAGTLRVLTYNIGGAVKPQPGAIERIVLEAGADVALFQECDLLLDAPSLQSKGYEVRVRAGMCLVTKLPIRKHEWRDRQDLEALEGAGRIERYTLDANGRDVIVVNVHLETVRDGLQAIRHSAWRGAPVLRANTGLRDLESRLAREYVDASQGPLLVAGDFNLPVESAIYDRHWSDLDNAFSEAGLGFGDTKVTRLFGIRIDHVLVGSAWEVERAWVGPDFGGDHRPMIADVRLK